MQCEFDALEKMFTDRVCNSATIREIRDSLNVNQSDDCEYNFVEQDIALSGIDQDRGIMIVNTPNVRGRYNDVTKRRKTRRYTPFITNFTSNNSVIKEVQVVWDSTDGDIFKSRALAIIPEPLPDDEDLFFSQTQKSLSDVSCIIQAIHQNDFLNRLDEEQIEMMVECFSHVGYKEGEVIIKEGSEGNAMYIVAEGNLSVTQSGTHLRNLSKGDVFGELAILYNCKRTATVTAMSYVLLWSIERKTYRAIMTSKSKKKREQIIGFLKTAKTLKSLPDSQLSKIFDSMEELKFHPNEVIVKEGEVGKTFYIILKGEVLVTKKNVNGQEKEIRIMKEGDHFGELALIRKICRTATCRSITDVTCITIDKEIFEETIPVECLELLNNVDTFDTPVLPEIKRCVFVSLYNTTEIYVPKNVEELIAVHYKHGQYRGEVVTLGVGAFGRVELVSHACTGDHFALKKLNKKYVVQSRQQEHVKLEKKILETVECNFIVKLYGTFKDAWFIYMVMEFCAGGELWTKLRQVGRFEEVIAVFCSACVVEAFDYLHGRGIVYRDLKPENLMMDKNGYIKLVDFGFAKLLQKGEKTYSFCGTPDYMAPEIIKNEGHDCSSDLWSLGVLIYELLVGRPPFSSSNPQKVYGKILDGIISFPVYVGDLARILICGLCR
ncbi:cGMP-dependent protein kinase 1-like [Protopterus annectens]|uniref:cGMP-dependent protein kinase 1-like n=1 Tax=Protopterus annectens TaxID=7888 RepID=UPI001CFB93B2|nr:cGMP-dependent protein kinase 1-like [Protopterus annectens]